MISFSTWHFLPIKKLNETAMAWKASMFFCCMDFPTWSHLAKLCCACFPRDRVGALYCQARLSLKFVNVFVCDCIAVSRTYRLNSRSCPCCFPCLSFKFVIAFVLRAVSHTYRLNSRCVRAPYCFPYRLFSLYCFPRAVDKGFR